MKGWSWREVRAGLILALAVLAARWAAIAAVGNDLPFWDQWDGEPDALFAKYVHGTLWLGDFLTPANEHRILFTRLLNLAVFVVDGERIDCMHMLFAQAVLHAGAAFLALLMLGRAGAPLPARAFTAAILAWPAAGENCFWSFQSQVYFQLLLSLAAVWELSRPGYSVPRLCWIILAGAVNMATTLVIPVLAVCASALYERGSAPGEHRWRAVFFAAAALAFYATIPFNPAHEALRVDSIGEFGRGLWRYLTWPGGWGLVALAPFGWLVREVLFRGRREEGLMRPLLLYLWVLALMALGSWGRKGPIPERYFDYFTFSVVAAVLTAGRAMRRPRWALGFAAAAAGYGFAFVSATWPQVKGWQERFSTGREVVLRALVAENASPARGASALKAMEGHPPYLYPTNERLALVLSKPETQYMLRRHLAGPAAAALEALVKGRRAN